MKTTPSPVPRIQDFERKVRRFITRRSGPSILRRTSVDDIWQQTVAIALGRSDQIATMDESRLGTYLCWIARRVIYSVWETGQKKPREWKLKRRLSTGLGVSEETLGFSGRTPSSIASSREDITALETAIHALPEHYARVIVLHKLQGLPLDVVAASVGRSKSATCNLLVRATRALQARFTES
ncbi:MAG: RNA polymerase sigma factor [Phycisphaerae bacterium]